MSTSESEEKIQKLVDFAMEFRNDPDFHRLVFPPAVLAKLAEKGIVLQPKEYSASAAVDRCFGMKTSERYVSNQIEVIDQTKLEVKFPNVPDLPPPSEVNPRLLKISDVEEKTEEKDKTE